MNKKWFSIVLVFFFSGVSLFSEDFSKIRNPFERPDLVKLKAENNQKAEEKTGVEMSVASLKLVGIINNSIAVINHGFYRVGDKIGEVTIKEIKGNAVDVDVHGKVYQLILKIPVSDSIKRSRQ